MGSNDISENAGDIPMDAGDASAAPEDGDGSVNLNDLMELEILREVDADGNPVEAVEDQDGIDGDTGMMGEEHRTTGVGAVDVSEPDEDQAAGDTELRIVTDDEPQDRADALEEERDRLREDLLRAQADFINFRKRMEREKSDMVRRANQSLIEQLLPVIDNFELALSNNQQADPDTYSEGVRLIHKQLVDLLSSHGLREVACVGEIFDPNIHEAVAVVSNPDLESNTVVAELKKGYYLRDRLIRSPMVQVVINEESGTDNGETQDAPGTPEPSGA